VADWTAAEHARAAGEGRRSPRERQSSCTHQAGADSGHVALVYEMTDENFEQ
jgi:hypothetical protein